MKGLPNDVRELRSKEPALMPARRRDHRHLCLPGERWASEMTDRTTER